MQPASEKLKKQKALRHFAGRVLKAAVEDYKWKNSAVVDLFHLFSSELNFNSDNAVCCLKRLRACATPILIASIIKKKNMVNLPHRDIMNIFIDQAPKLGDLCELIGESISVEIFDLDSEETLLEVTVQ